MANFINFVFSETIDLPFKVIEYFKDFNSYSFDKKHNICSETDNLVSSGNAQYRLGNLNGAVEFYHKALNIHPINNDALQNMYACYKELNMNDKMVHVEIVWNCVKELKGIN